MPKKKSESAGEAGKKRGCGSRRKASKEEGASQ